MKRITLVIAPTNSCNLSCDYCYNKFSTGNVNLDFNTLEYIIDIAFREYEFVQFVWRGGEPLLVGIEYYKKVLKCQRKAARKNGTNYANAFQTNGTLINREWITFLKRNSISVGISFDGISNDSHRGKSQEVLSAFELCKKMKFPVGCITVVNRENSNLIEQYEYIKRYANTIKFSPCFGEDVLTYNIDSKVYADNLWKLFEYWATDKKGIAINPLVNYIYGAMDIYMRRECIDGMCLGQFLDIDAHGVARICSHSSDDSYIIGNINRFASFVDLFNNSNFNVIVERMIEKQKECKQACSIYKFCMGGCCVNRLADSTFMCEVLNSVYPQIVSKVHNIIKNRESLVGYNLSIRKIVNETISKNPELLLLK